MRLPDHDFNIGAKHLLVPSVLGVCRIDETGSVSYSGETYIAVRSLKNNNSSAYSHQEDLMNAVKLFPDAFCVDGNVKPVLVKGVDGGPDENPRFDKTINMAVKTFTDLGLDRYIEVTNAPGLSAYYKVERKMCPLSNALTGVVLPADSYGSHLQNGKTIDEDLEVKNFKAAGEALASIWNELVIDEYPCVAEFIENKPAEEVLKFQSSATFRRDHVFETQYLTAYLKCGNSDCCEPFRCKVESLFPHRQIPPLIPIEMGCCGPQALDITKDLSDKDIRFANLTERIVYGDKLIPDDVKSKYGSRVPYDLYVPTLKDKIEKRICKDCFKYHATVKSLTAHKKVCSKKKHKKTSQAVSVFLTTESSSSDSSDNESILDQENLEIVAVRPKFSVIVADSFVEKIVDLKEWLKTPWEEV